MKKLFILFGIFLLVGAGCFGGESTNEGGDVDGLTGESASWWLEFDLPEGWAQYAYYGEDVSDPGSLEIQSNGTDIVLQSTTLPVVLVGKTPGELVESYVDKDFTYIRVFRYDPRTSIPNDAELISDHFYKRVISGDEVLYYYESESGNYKFVVDQEGQELGVAEAVILSASE